MYIFKYSSRFKKDLKRVKKNKNFDIEILSSIIEILRVGKKLNEKYRNHKLHGEFKECYECHLKPNIFLMYRIDQKDGIVYLFRIGSHSELFG